MAPGTRPARARPADQYPDPDGGEDTQRWLGGAESFGDDLAAYRLYMVNHEVGQGLGHGHVGCPAAGTPAPIMMQQTKTTGACSQHSWRFPDR